MASSPLDVTPTGSIDTAGFSVATAMASATDPRAGSLYDNALAACVPVYITPMGDEHLMVFSRRWKSATPSPTIPGHYISYTIDNTPGWMFANGPTGDRRPVEGSSYDIPMRTAHDSRALTAATARPPHSLYLLSTVAYGSGVTAVLQHVTYNSTLKTLTVMSEETIPDGHLSGPPLAFVYNVPGVNSLILNPVVTAKIFNGDITIWDHADIAALNPGVPLPSTAIIPVYRDGSVEINSRLQAYFSSSVEWPGTGDTYLGTGTPAADAHSAVTAVESTDGAITYTEKPHALQSSCPTARFGSITVIFDRGIYFSGQYIMVFGASAAGKVCLARKPWGRIGIPATPWEYFTGTGWDTDTTELQQVDTTAGTKLTTAGPISAFGFEQNRVRIAVVTTSGSQRYAQVYSQTNDLKWKPAGVPIGIGSTTDGSYQGGTLQFQPQLLARGDLVETPESSAAIPACYTKKVFSGGISGLQVYWSAWQISRLY